MFSFFNKQSPYKAALQIYNLVTVALVAHDLATKPEATWSEDGFDILVHLASAIALQVKPSVITDLSSVLLNSVRIGAIYSGVTSGGSAIPLALNIVDVANHLVNLASSNLIKTSLVAVCSEENQTQEHNEQHPKRL